MVFDFTDSFFIESLRELNGYRVFTAPKHRRLIFDSKIIGISSIFMERFYCVSASFSRVGMGSFLFFEMTRSRFIEVNVKWCFLIMWCGGIFIDRKILFVVVEKWKKSVHRPKNYTLTTQQNSFQNASLISKKWSKMVFIAVIKFNFSSYLGKCTHK